MLEVDMATDVVWLDPVARVFEAFAGSNPQLISVRAHRDLDMAAAPAARHELEGLLSADDPDWVLVRLGDECFVDLHGLRVLLEVAARLRARGGELLVVAPPHSLRIMVHTMGLEDELFFAPTAAHAARRPRDPGGVVRAVAHRRSARCGRR